MKNFEEFIYESINPTKAVEQLSIKSREFSKVPTIDEFIKTVIEPTPNQYGKMWGVSQVVPFFEMCGVSRDDIAVIDGDITPTIFATLKFLRNSDFFYSEFDVSELGINTNKTFWKKPFPFAQHDVGTVLYFLSKNDLLNYKGYIDKYKTHITGKKFGI